MVCKCKVCGTEYDPLKTIVCTNKKCPESKLPEPMAAEAGANVAAPIMQDMLVKHDYRKIKVAEDTYITIDLEEMKCKLAEELLPPSLFQNGA